MFDISKLSGIEQYAHLKLIRDADALVCEHDYKHHFNFKFPFVRYNKRTRYKANLVWSVQVFTMRAFNIVKDIYARTRSGVIERLVC